MGRYLELAADVIAELDATSLCEKSEISEIRPSADSGSHVALIAVPRGVPLEWAEGTVQLLAMPAPLPYDDSNWQVIREDAFAFLTGWAAQAHGLGWMDLDCFGVHRHRPLARLDCMGLVPALDGAQVIALTQDLATIVTPRGSRQTVGRPTNIFEAEVSLVWDLGLDTTTNQRRTK